MADASNTPVGSGDLFDPKNVIKWLVKKYDPAVGELSDGEYVSRYNWDLLLQKYESLASVPRLEGVPKRPKTVHPMAVTQEAWDYGVYYANEANEVFDALESLLARKSEETALLRTSLDIEKRAAADARERYCAELAAKNEEDAGLRKRIHQLEGHNQYFFRCESAWCNPSDSFHGNPALENLKGAMEKAEASLATAEEARKRVENLINTPSTTDFVKSIELEAAHQVLRWSADHDGGKADADWFWLVGYLAGKVFSAPSLEKKLHHIITTAAVCLNWHRHVTGEITEMRPGIEPPLALLSGEGTKR